VPAWRWPSSPSASGVAYFILPYASGFLYTFQTKDIKLMLTADAYFGFVTLLFLAFGMVMEFPIVPGPALQGGHRHLQAAEQLAEDGPPGDRDLLGASLRRVRTW
jgi:hypothetical protein